jgi:hypothetical protein
LFEYAKKLAALNQYGATLSFGFPKVLTKRVSFEINVTSFAGPQTNGPAKAPIDVAPEGTTVVRSISDTLIPGESRVAMDFSLCC